MSTKAKAGREIPLPLIVAGIVVLVLLMGAGGWYAFNGGWATAAQQDQAYKHEMLPIMAAKHGDTGALEAENRLRKQQGQALLSMPKDKKATSSNDPAKLADLQRRLGARPGGQSDP